jgi:hypothetical protein
MYGLLYTIAYYLKSFFKRPARQEPQRAYAYNRVYSNEQIRRAYRRDS